MTSALILAGGKSSRFGSDKTLLAFRGEPSITHYVFKVLSGIFSDVRVSAKSSKFSPALPLLKDDFEDFAPIFVLSRLDLYFLEPVFISPADMPNITQSTIKTLFDELKDCEVSYAKAGGKEHFLCGFFRPSIAQKAREQIAKNELAIHKLFRLCDTCATEFRDPNEFININTASDLKMLINSRI